jgi:hypothetical protein
VSKLLTKLLPKLKFDEEIKMGLHSMVFPTISTGYNLNEKPKSIISPDKNSRWQHNISRSYTDFLLISNSPDNIEEI